MLYHQSGPYLPSRPVCCNCTANLSGTPTISRQTYVVISGTATIAARGGIINRGQSTILCTGDLSASGTRKIAYQFSIRFAFDDTILDSNYKSYHVIYARYEHNRPVVILAERDGQTFRMTEAYQLSESGYIYEKIVNGVLGNSIDHLLKLGQVDSFVEPSEGFRVAYLGEATVDGNEAVLSLSQDRLNKLGQITSFYEPNAGNYTVTYTYDQSLSGSMALGKVAFQLDKLNNISGFFEPLLGRVLKNISITSGNTSANIYGQAESQLKKLKNVNGFIVPTTGRQKIPQGSK